MSESLISLEVSAIRTAGPFLLAAILVARLSLPAIAVGSGFIENQGQINEAVRYYTMGTRFAVYFTTGAIVLDLKDAIAVEGPGGLDLPPDPLGRAEPEEPASRRGCSVHIKFESANPSPLVEAREKLDTEYNFFLGNDPTRWRTGVPVYCEVIYRDLWPGLSLIFREEAGGLSYEIVAESGVTLNQMNFSYAGADQTTFQKNGYYMIETSVGTLLDIRPGSEGNLGSLAVENVGYEAPVGYLARDNPSALVWSTFIGGGGVDVGYAIDTDISGNLTIVVHTISPDFPVSPGAYDTAHNGNWDIAVVKCSSSGSQLLWATFLGGSGADGSQCLCLDANDNVIVGGTTESLNFPVTQGAYDTVYNGGHYDLFVAKLSSFGNELTWSTFVGGNNWDAGGTMAVDSVGNVLVAGYTYSYNFPVTTGSYDTSHNGGCDVFVSKLSMSGSDLVWGTFLGASENDTCLAVALDTMDNVVIMGNTYSPNFPVSPGAYAETYSRNGDVFLGKLAAEGNTLLWSTFLGGAYNDCGRGLVLSEVDEPIVCGSTLSPDFPTTTGAFDQTYSGGGEGYISKLSNSGDMLVWCTFVGGAATDRAYTINIDDSNRPVIGGNTSSSDFPVTADAYDSTYSGGTSDGFVAVLEEDASSLLWSSFLGGGDEDVVRHLVLAPSGHMVVTGYSGSVDFPVTSGSYDSSFNGSLDVFAAMLAQSTVLPIVIVLTAPNSVPPNIWSTPSNRQITWELVAGQQPDHWALFYSTDGGEFDRLIDDDVRLPGSPYAYDWRVPPIGTADLKVKVKAIDAGGQVIGFAENSIGQVLYNVNGVGFQHDSSYSADGISEPRQVLKWGIMPDAHHYRVTITQEGATACASDPLSPVEAYVDYNDLLGRPPTFMEIPSPFWENMVPSLWRALITAYDAGDQPTGESEEKTFIKCKLGDLDPYDDMSKVPILLVHGWTSDSSTWFDNGCSPFVQALINNGPVADRQHPWTFEYPNIGSIRQSATGLGDAVEYILNMSRGDHAEVMLAAHSMGGLVCRTYMQSEAVIPADPSLQYNTFRNDVARLVTLSSPHLGENYIGTAAWFLGLSGSCDGFSDGSQSVQDLDHRGDLIADLASSEVPATVEYFFTSGTDYTGEKNGGIRNIFLETLCFDGSDGTVDVCSATGGQCGGIHDNPSLSFGTADAVFQNYHLPHNLFSKPGIEIQGEPNRNAQLANLLNDVVEFIQSGAVTGATGQCPYGNLNAARIELEGGGGSWKGMEKQDVESGEERRGGEYALWGNDGRKGGGRIGGASLLIRNAESTNPDEGICIVTNGAGIADVNLMPGDYVIQIEADGYENRTEHLSLEDSTGNILWHLDLAEDESYVGPKNAVLIINGGAQSTPDSVVTLTLSCDNAVDFQLAEHPDLLTSQWNPMTATYPWEFSSLPGLKFLFVQYRDNQGTESQIVSSRIVLTADHWGSIDVGSSLPGAKIILDSRDTGLTTPASLDSISPGLHYVSLSFPGHLSAPVVAVAEVDSGGIVSVDFDLTSSLPPSAVDISSLGQAQYLSGSPFSWDSAVDPDDGLDIFYDITIATDEVLNDVVWRQIGIADTVAFLAQAVSDSQEYFIAIESVDIHGMRQVEPTEARAFYLDRTSPDVSIMKPETGDSLIVGGLSELVTEVEDWAGCERIVAKLLINNAAADIDTVYAGAWNDTITWQVPNYGFERYCDLVISAVDSSGNIGSSLVDSVFVSHDGIVAVPGEKSPSHFAFSPPFANPFSSSTRFNYAVPKAGKVEIAIYDLRGRLIRQLSNRHHEAGYYDTAWNGRDETGRIMASGVYFLKMKSSTYKKTRKVLLLR